MVWALIFFVFIGDDNRPVRLGDFAAEQACLAAAEQIERDQRWGYLRSQYRPFATCIRVRPRG